MGSGQMKLREMSRTGPITARKKHVLGVHSRRELRDQVGSSALSNVSYPKTGFLRCGGCRSANGRYLQRWNDFAQIQADLGGPFRYGVNGILAAENDPFKFFPVQFLESVVKLVKIQRRLNAHDR
jgi:hypothetical protein